MRVAIYARVSTGDQDEENQLIALRDYCRRREWTIQREYREKMSGGRADRPQFNAMMLAASRREFDVVLTWALDRLTREGVCETFVYVKRLRESGVEYESFQEPHFRTMGGAGELMIAIAAWIAEAERKRRVERTKAGLVKARREGKQLGRPARVWPRDKAVTMRAAGHSWREISAALKVPVGTVRAALAKENA